MTLRNIPPFWEALSHWLSLMVYVQILPKRLKGWKFWCVSLVFFGLFLGLDVKLQHYSGFLFNVGKTVFSLLTLLLLAAVCRIRWTAGVYYSARAFIVAGFTASLSWQLYLYLSRNVLLLGSILAEALFMVSLYILVLVVILFLERHQVNNVPDMPISPSSCSMAVFMAILIYIFSSLSYAPIETPFGATSDAEIYNLRTIVYFAGVALLMAYHTQLCQSHAVAEVKSLNDILMMQYANYQMSEETIDMVNRKYHDLKHLIHLLRHEVSEEVKLGALDRLEGEIRSYEAQNKTGNKVLDTILTSKSNHCQNNGIQLTCVADGEALGFLDVMDLSTIFGNALDNAIEGVSCLKDPEQRLIHLSVAREKHFLRIRVENRCREDLVVKKGLPVTTKGDKHLHGYGLKSIFYTAQKHGGSATVLASDGWFELRILIPFPEDNQS